MAPPRSVLLSAAVLALLTFAGCYRPPQVAPDNLELISSLRTAISTRSLERLDQNVQAIHERQATGEMSAAEAAAFMDLIEMARDGRWEAAEQRVVAFQKRQRPSQEQIDRLPKPKPRTAA